MSPFVWIKNNKFTTLLLLIILFLVLRLGVSGSSLPSKSSSSSNSESAGRGGVPNPALKSQMADTAMMAPGAESAPQPEITERKVVEESNVSMVVDDVRGKMDKILDETKKKEGYMVSSTLNQPEEAPFANLVLRVPNKELRPMLVMLRSLAIKVTSENLRGTDVTDQYTDLEARLKTLETTKAKFEEIMAKAYVVNDIMQVQQQLVYIQDQIDSIKGQQQYLDKTSENSKLTIYLSTDEFSLPYAPQDSFRPSVIFKQAVRSLVSALRGLAKAAIWIVVFGVIWVPVVIIIYLLKKYRKK